MAIHAREASLFSLRLDPHGRISSPWISLDFCHSGLILIFILMGYISKDPIYRVWILKKLEKPHLWISQQTSFFVEKSSHGLISESESHTDRIPTCCHSRTQFPQHGSHAAFCGIKGLVLLSATNSYISDSSCTSEAFRKTLGSWSLLLGVRDTAPNRFYIV